MFVLRFVIAILFIVYNLILIFYLLYEWTLMAADDADDHDNVFVMKPREAGGGPQYVVKRTVVGRLTPWQWQDEWNRVSEEFMTSKEAWAMAPALFVETIEAFGITGADGCA
jgi:hypothetical protein